LFVHFKIATADLCGISCTPKSHHRQMSVDRYDNSRN
jgi:hypothetical protein